MAASSPSSHLVGGGGHGADDLEGEGARAAGVQYHAHDGGHGILQPDDVVYRHPGWPAGEVAGERNIFQPPPLFFGVSLFSGTI